MGATVLANPQLQGDYEEVRLFLDSIYRDEEGYSYVALKSPDAEHHAFSQFFFEWPVEREQQIDFILEKRSTHEVYYSPALFTEKSAKKEHVKGSRVFWIELDGKTPDGVDSIPGPTLRVQSSTNNHEHWYWQTDNLIGVEDIERVNRALTHLLGADASGWDAVQILRPPSTFNHKRKKPVVLIDPPTGKLVSLKDFSSLPEPPPTITIPVPTSIPEATDVIAKFEFGAVAWNLFKNGVPEGQRSEGEMALGYYLAEMGMTDQEMFSVLLNADNRWGKFKNRQDQYVRLSEIVSIARKKYPYKDAKFQGTGETQEGSLLKGIGFVTFIQTEYHFEWLLDGWIQKGGYGLLTGLSGVGKTQLSLDLAMHLATGSPWLTRAVERPVKIGFLSLEMGGPDLQVFCAKQSEGWSKEHQDLMEENLIIEAVGEPIYMDTPSGRSIVEQWIGDLQLEGVIIDSLGSSVAGELSAEAPAKAIMDWNDHLRQTFDVFTWFLHHHRKPSGDNKKPNKLADVYGSHWLTARATSVSCLWDVGAGNTLQIIPLKMRLSGDKEPFFVKRQENLRFIRVDGKDVQLEKSTTSKPEDFTPGQEDEEGPKDKLVKGF